MAKVNKKKKWHMGDPAVTPAKRVNDNCLRGIRCPKCKSTEPFNITASCEAQVYDDGVTDTFDFDWDDDASCECGECGFTGEVQKFYLKRDKKKEIIAFRFKGEQAKVILKCVKKAKKAFKDQGHTDGDMLEMMCLEWLLNQKGRKW